MERRVRRLGTSSGMTHSSHTTFSSYDQNMTLAHPIPTPGMSNTRPSFRSTPSMRTLTVSGTTWKRLPKGWDGRRFAASRSSASYAHMHLEALALCAARGDSDVADRERLD